MTTEITDTTNLTQPLGWVLYDGACPLCLGLARRFAPLLGRHGFALAPLQTPWVQQRLDLKPGAPLTEMRLLTAGGHLYGGAGAIVQIARGIGWARPCYALAQIPGVMPLLHLCYRYIADHRSCAGGVCNIPQPRRWPVCVPLVVLPIAALIFGAKLPAWAFMWALAMAIGAGCKWLTWRLARPKAGPVRWARSLGYLTLWPGMDAVVFLDAKRKPQKPGPRAWLFAALKVLIGAALIWGVVPLAASKVPLAAAWMGAMGLCVLVHFGLFHLLALAWQRAGVEAKPIMHAPILSTSLSEFWSKRWNTAFNLLAFEFVFRPLARQIRIVGATLAAFLASGLVHDLVISIPARGGLGLPTAYFLLQGIGVLIERSAVGRKLGLGRGWRGWLFTLVCTTGPAFWLFHPPFMKQVMLPFLRAIGAF